MAPPIIGPIIVDFHITQKQKYTFKNMNMLDNFNMAGIVSFVVGAGLGLYLYAKQVNIAFPVALLSLCATMIVYFLWTLKTK